MCVKSFFIIIFQGYFEIKYLFTYVSIFNKLYIVKIRYTQNNSLINEINFVNIRFWDCQENVYDT